MLQAAELQVKHDYWSGKQGSDQVKSQSQGEQNKNSFINCHYSIGCMDKKGKHDLEILNVGHNPN